MKRAALLVLVSIFYINATAQLNYWQQQVNYNITVSLNDTEHTLDAVEQMEYFNNSSDTLFFIWIHLWPNAYKNDHTAFSDQRLENGSTDFYFSDNDKRGYINRLNFKVDGTIAAVEDHPQHQDIIKLLLPSPLAPKHSCKIETPFHVKLPFNFSRGGHVDQSYQITQWYPKAAVYDKKGWHEMPYLDQGEFYSDFGNYEVAITLPANYVIAATGEIAKETIQPEINVSRVDREESVKRAKKSFFPAKKIAPVVSIPSAHNFKTIVYKQNDVIDFAWFADKRFTVKKDTLALPSGRIINVAAYSIQQSKGEAYWKNAVQYIKKAVLTRSNRLGGYPYNIVSAVQGDLAYNGGMEYPTITLIAGVQSEQDLEELTEHEAGHNWLYGILASNEREHPWMDEGMNTYYGIRYWDGAVDINIRKKETNKFLVDRLPANLNYFLLGNVLAQRKDQPIATNSEKLSHLNYDMSAYHKASQWMRLLEQTLGRPLFDSCMQEYFKRWEFKHPYPEDFKAVLENVSGKNLDEVFSLLNKKGGLPNTNTKKELKLASFFSFKDTDKYKYIFVSPVAGFNMYDKLMLGFAVHNYTLPAEKLQFFLAPMYATGSKQLNGIGTLNYHWYPNNNLQKVEIGLNGSRFSSNHSLDTTGKKIFENFFRIVPFVRLHFKHGYRSTLASWVDIRSFIIGEKQFDKYGYITGSDSANLYPMGFLNRTRYINQLTFSAENSRVLYPYSYQLQLQQGDGFYRMNATGNYFFNYAKGGGMQVRLFAAKFGYMGERNSTAYLYQPKLLAGNGVDDYTNSNYFLGRTASTAFGNLLLQNGGKAAQQVMIQNTGGLKLRLDPYSSVQGYSENWVASFNFTTTLPNKLLPVKLPLKIFFDAGTYSEAWGKNSVTPRFLYVAGLQLSLFKNVLNIYAPIIYSTAFRDQLKTDTEANKFFKKITFSIDIQNLSLKKFFPQFSF